VEFLIATMSTLVDMNEHGKDVTTSEQNPEKLKAYKIWLKKDQFAHYTLRLCMHDNLLGGLECCPTAKDMWNRLKI